MAQDRGPVLRVGAHEYRRRHGRHGDPGARPDILMPEKIRIRRCAPASGRVGRAVRPPLLIIVSFLMTLSLAAPAQAGEAPGDTYVGVVDISVAVNALDNIDTTISITCTSLGTAACRSSIQAEISFVAKLDRNVDVRASYSSLIRQEVGRVKRYGVSLIRLDRRVLGSTRADFALILSGQQLGDEQFGTDLAHLNADAPSAPYPTILPTSRTFWIVVLAFGVVIIVGGAYLRLKLISRHSLDSAPAQIATTGRAVDAEGVETGSG